MLKFIADVNVGKLAKWLRMLGFDTLYNSRYDDLEIIRIALDEDRYILTRDTGIAQRKSAKKCILITSDETIQQLRQVVKESKIKICEENAFSRCIICNNVLQPIQKETVFGKVPPYIYKIHNKFAFCCNCQKYFWQGSHLDGMKSIISRLKNQDSDADFL